MKTSRRKLLVAAPFVIIPKIANAAWSQFQASTNPDPWINLDGRTNAPVTAAPFPTILNGYPLNASPSARVRWPTLTGFQPQWEVAGVDYGVGPNAQYGGSTPWKVPGVDTMPSGASFAGTTITISGSNVVLDGWDLTQSAAQSISVTGANATVSNCKLKLTADSGGNPISASGSGTNCLVKYCDINLNGFNTSSTAAVNYTTVSASGITIKYCFFRFTGSDFLYPNTGNDANIINFNVFYSVFYNAGCEVGSHPDWMQLGGQGTYQFNISYCLFIQENTHVGSQPLVFDAQGSTTAPISGICSNNVFLTLNQTSSTALTGGSGVGAGTSNNNNMIAIHYSETSIGTGFTCNQNYFDPTGDTGGFWGNQGGTVGAGCTFSGNIRMDLGRLTSPSSP